ncbi:hypothetical protein F5Y18DRAFT_431461 [Xylariaceae sp. FL1019]|nr:hypothetical protein F5Y18DRAFT_431461 [Xylariaceae sp. FL1019]
MPSSTKTTYWGKTPTKSSHYFDANPPTGRSDSNREQEDYRISRFTNGPSSTVQPSNHSAQDIEAAHRARVAAELRALQPRLP